MMSLPLTVVDPQPLLATSRMTVHLLATSLAIIYQLGHSQSLRFSKVINVVFTNQNGSDHYGHFDAAGVKTNWRRLH